MNRKVKHWIGTIVLAVFTLVIVQPTTSFNANAQSGDLKKVRIGVGTRVLGITYPWLNLPRVFGWWEEEGYDVEVLPMGASMEVVQQLVAGNLDIGQFNASVLVQSNVMKDIPLRGIMMNTPVDWSLSVLADSDIKSVSDLKGHSIGVYSLASGGVPFLKALLKANDVNPDKDVKLIATGFGAPPIQALKNGDVSALMYWGTATVGFENSGLKLRLFRGKEWLSFPDFGLIALKGKIDSDSKMIEAIARGAAKGTLFAFANPDCVRKIQWKTWPKTKARNSDESIAIKWDMNALNTQLEGIKQWHEINGGKLYGKASADGYGMLQTFLHDAKLIDHTIAPSTFEHGLEGFYKRINDFDHDKIIALAKACKIN